MTFRVLLMLVSYSYDISCFANAGAYSYNYDILCFVNAGNL